MKMVKSLLLGSAAGVVAVAGAQAADLPVKAKPVEYVRICSLYGAGYYYIPGTDICLKLGGHVRYQHNFNPGTSVSGGPLNGIGGFNNRVVEGDTQFRVRAYITVDTRQQTAYGTLRTYALFGFNQDTTSAATTAPAVYMTRGFIQFAGFTFGKATSFFDIFPSASFAYNAGMLHVPDTGDAGQMLAAYTAQFGNGFSATIAAEQVRDNGTVNANNTAFALGAVPPVTGNHPGVAGVSQFPDIVGNLRVDQAWGSVLVAGALHGANGSYYNGAPGGSLSQANGHPSNKIGWAVTAGFIFNLPMIAPGDRLSAQWQYAQGATKYTYGATPSSAGHVGFNGALGYGWAFDGIYGGTIAAGTATGVELTTSWSVGAAFEHFWTPALRTSIYGSYFQARHTEVARSLFCIAGITGVTVAATCNPNFEEYVIGSRTQWEPVRGLGIGLDVVYTHLKTAQANNLGVTTVTTTQNGLSSGVYNTANQSAWMATFRIFRDFVP
jgi:hypothetical protein